MKLSSDCGILLPSSDPYITISLPKQVFSFADIVDTIGIEKVTIKWPLLGTPTDIPLYFIPTPCDDGLGYLQVKAVYIEYPGIHEKIGAPDWLVARELIRAIEYATNTSFANDSRRWECIAGDCPAPGGAK